MRVKENKDNTKEGVGYVLNILARSQEAAGTEGQRTQMHMHVVILVTFQPQLVVAGA